LVQLQQGFAPAGMGINGQLHCKNSKPPMSARVISDTFGASSDVGFTPKSDRRSVAGLDLGQASWRGAGPYSHGWSVGRVPFLSAERPTCKSLSVRGPKPRALSLAWGFSFRGAITRNPTLADRRWLAIPVSPG
jgi:hypothetical protein